MKKVDLAKFKALIKFSNGVYGRPRATYL